MATTLTVAELADTEPGELGVSGWFPIEQWRVDMFAEATDDRQWIHVDPERAAEGPFGGTIAHGYLTLSLIPALLKRILTISDHARGINYGIEKARFTSPVPVGSSVQLRAELTETDWRSDGGLRYVLACTLEVEGRDRPALVASVVYITYSAAVI